MYQPASRSRVYTQCAECHILHIRPNHSQYSGAIDAEREECVYYIKTVPIPLLYAAQCAMSLLLLLYSRNILPADEIPAGHVLLHARAEASFLAAGDGGAGLWDAALEAVFVNFLY